MKQNLAKNFQFFLFFIIIFFCLPAHPPSLSLSLFKKKEKKKEKRREREKREYSSITKAPAGRGMEKRGRKMDERNSSSIHSSAPQTLGFRALRRCLNFGAFCSCACLLVLLVVADFVAFPRVLCGKILEYVIRSRLSGWSAFEVLDSSFFFPVSWELVLSLCRFWPLELSRRKNEILLFFLPSLIVESCKSTALFSNSLPAVDKGSGEEKKKTKQKEKEKEKKRSLFLFCRFWLWSCRDE
jgi:hypothetical protein